MTSAEQFANLLTTTQGDNELRLAGLAEFQACVRDVIHAGEARLLAFSDESFMLDELHANHNRELTTFENSEDLSWHLMESTEANMRALRECLLEDPGSDEFDDDPTGPDEEEDDDSPELA